jgi:hypothetical protein
VPNSIDDDCDNEIDENYLWSLSDTGEYVENIVYYADEDGDGFSLNNRDCNDSASGANIYPGNYEIERVNRVVNELQRVFLIAGTFPDLNSTTPGPGSLVSSDSLGHELHTNSQWNWNTDWFGSAPATIEPSGLPAVVLDVFLPTLYGQRVPEIEPNDDGAGSANVHDLGLLSLPPYVDRVDGIISSIVPNSGNGDNDYYKFITQESGYVNLELDWGTCDPTADAEEAASAGTDEDYDAYLYCYFGNAFNPYALYLIDSAGAASLAKPESSRSIVRLPAGSECYALVNGFNGTPGPYSLKIYLEL